MTTEANTVAQLDEAPTRQWFRNPESGRVRAGWRILGFLGILYVIALPMLFGLRAAIGFSKSSPLVIVIIAVSATAAVLLARRFIDGRSVTSLGLQVRARSVLDVIVGFFISAVLAGSVFAVLSLLGAIDEIRLASFSATALRALVLSLAIMALVSFWEELVFRGYLLQNMAEGLGLAAAITVSCFLYGLLHAMNPNASLLSSAIIVLFGYLRIYGLLTTGQLWLSMGMHWGWNFCQATIFGFAASGHAEEWTLIRHEIVAPEWLSGGNFGPEASIVTIPFVLLALLAMRAWSRSRILQDAPSEWRG